MAKIKITKHQIFVSLGILAIVCATIGAGAFVWWLQNKDKPGVVAPFNAAIEHTLPKAAEDAQKLALAGDTAAATKKIEDALAKPNVSDSDKYALNLQQGVTYSNQRQYQKALDFFKLAEAVRQDFTVYHLMAEQYEALGDKPNAIEYFKKALTKLDTTSPGYTSDKEIFEAKVKALGGTL